MTPRIVWTSTLLLAYASACTPEPDQQPATLGAAIENVRPHAAEFERYESWVARAVSVADTRGGKHALAETLFAPVRNDSTVIAAWIEVGRKPGRVFSLPPDNPWPDTRQWTAARDSVLGKVRVARHDHCPVEAPRWWRNDATAPCIMIARDPSAPRRTGARIAMAFASAP